MDGRADELDRHARQVWHGLRDRSERLSWAAPGDPRGTAFDNLGRSWRGGGDAPADSARFDRVGRLRLALDESQRLARQTLAERFALLDLAAIWPILESLARDVALWVGGGALAGGVAGALFFGIGAVPGAALGASAGGMVLNWIGLAGLAGDLIRTLPQAFEHYERGFRTAWGAEPETHWRGRATPEPVDDESFAIFSAAHEFARGHAALIAALLLALMVWFTRGRGDKARMLAEIRASRRLGPKVAQWVETHEGRFGPQMAMEASGSGAKGRARRAASPTGSSAVGSPSAIQNPSSASSIAGAGSNRPSQPGVVGQASGRSIGFSQGQVQHAFKHAKDFGISGNANVVTLAEFQKALESHVVAVGTQAVPGTYRGLPVTHFIDPSSGLNVIRDASGNFLSGWKLSAPQLQHVLTTGKLGGG